MAFEYCQSLQDNLDPPVRPSAAFLITRWSEYSHVATPVRPICWLMLDDESKLIDCGSWIKSDGENLPFHRNHPFEKLGNCHRIILGGLPCYIAGYVSSLLLPRYQAVSLST